MFPLRNLGHQNAQIAGIAPYGPPGNLTMKDLGGDIGIIGRYLSPSGRSVFCGQPCEGDGGYAEGFQFGDFHDWASSKIIAAPLAPIIIADALVLPETILGKIDVSTT